MFSGINTRAALRGFAMISSRKLALVDRHGLPKGAEDFVFDGLAQLDVSWRDQRERPGSRSNRAVSALNSRLPSSLTSSNSPFENRYSR